MAFNWNNAINNGVAMSSAAGQIGGLPGYLGGAVAGLSTGFLGSNSAESLSMEDAFNLQMFNIAKDMYYMDMQNKYNTSNMRLQTDLQKELQQQQFEHNKYFIDNAYQMTTADMKAAGINPILAAGSSNVGSVGSGSAAALGASVPNTSSMSPADMLSANANSSNAKVAKTKMATDILNSLADIRLKDANSAKANQEAETQDSIRNLNYASAKYQNMNAIYKQIETSMLPEKMKAEIKQLYASAYYQELMADIANLKKDSEINLNNAKAYEATENAKSNRINAEANRTTAEQGSPWKTVMDVLNDKFGDPKKGSNQNGIQSGINGVRRGFDERFNHDENEFHRFYGR